MRNGVSSRSSRTAALRSERRAASEVFFSCPTPPPYALAAPRDPPAPPAPPAARQRADALLAHEPGRLADVGLRPHGDHAPRHDLADRERAERLGQVAEPVLDARVEDDLPEVAVGHDADEPGAAVHDRQGGGLPPPA